MNKNIQFSTTKGDPENTQSRKIIIIIIFRALLLFILPWIRWSLLEGRYVNAAPREGPFDGFEGWH